MQDNLIYISKNEIDNQTVNSVSARDLHKFLKSKQDFSTWIKARLEDFVANVDFIKLHKKMELSKTRQTGIEYYLTIETAKHIAMLEKNEHGKKIRQYFIEIEKQQLKPRELTRKELALLVIQQEEEKEKLLLENETQKNIIIEQEKHLINNQDLNYTTIAKNLHVKPMKFTEWLRDNNYINKKNIPNQQYIDKGYFSVKSHIILLNGETKGFIHGFIRPKGYSYFLDKKIKGFMKDIEVKSY